MRNRLLSLSLLPFVVALAACGSSSSNSSTSGSGTNSSSSSSSSTTSSGSGGGSSVSVGESEFQLSPKDASVKAGKVTITVKNNGTVTHALALEKAGPGGQDLKSQPLQPGQSTTITATLKKGKVEWYCPIDGHKGMGMVGELTVT